MQIKITTKYNFTPTRMATITILYKKRTILGKAVQKQDPSDIAGGNVNGTATVENSSVIHQKIQHRIIK